MDLQCNNHHYGHNTYKKTVLVLALLSLAGLLMKVPQVPKVPQVLMKVEKILEQVYTQSPIIKNGPIKNSVEIFGKFKERTLSRSKLRNA